MAFKVTLLLKTLIRAVVLCFSSSVLGWKLALSNPWMKEKLSQPSTVLLAQRTNYWLQSSSKEVDVMVLSSNLRLMNLLKYKLPKVSVISPKNHFRSILSPSRNPGSAGEWLDSMISKDSSKQRILWFCPGSRRSPGAVGSVTVRCGLLQQRHTNEIHTWH